MDYFFNPKGLAVVGATANPKKGGNIIIANLLKGYTGRIYPVNPRYDTIEGLTCYPSLRAVPDPVDLAVVFVGAEMVPQVIRDCAVRGIPGAMIESAGFAEIGAEGVALQQETARIAGEGGVRLWGPNCMGLVDVKNRRVFSTVTSSIWEQGMIPGKVALIVQSGMLAGAFLIDVMSHGVMGMGKACSIGNKMDVAECDLLEYLLADPDTGVIGLYLESIVDGPRFISLCKAANKPIVVLKGGKSDEGAAAAVSHTASMAGDGAVVSGAFRQAGVVEADDFYQMMDYCRVLEAFDDLPSGLGNRVAIMTYSGGAGIVSADFLVDSQLAMATLSRESLTRLEDVFPSWMAPGNPVDLWPGILLNGTHKAYNETLAVLMADPGVDAVFAHCFVGGFDLEPQLDIMAGLSHSARKPLFCWISGERNAVSRFQRQALDLKIPAFREVKRAVDCLGKLLAYHRRRHQPVDDRIQDIQIQTVPLDRLSGGPRVLDERASKSILKRAGIPVVEEIRVMSPAEADKAADRFGWPVVLKGVVPGAVHKTEAGLVVMNIHGRETLHREFEGMALRVGQRGGMLLQPQLPAGLELIVGLIRDPQFGPCVMCGLGGILTEALNDRAFAVAPLSHGDALALIGRLKSQQLLDGFRGATALDRDALADVLVRLGALGVAYPAVREVDINPFIVVEGRPVAVDAAVML
ncbi:MULTISPECIES: acetate--CoA ligase family protein [Desulfococcus]|jgi:acetyltransferase|uniref:CoA-binding domain protein n=1 Tax=Desulfococcus multivorans DSM 2059 TaxID=1121405 RepID=S7TW02_DESML|nr:acetate--CoA ligase family protein [Desulfococcus multivorans]AOY59586.1 SucC1: succinyl-CoA ligase, subunit gamma [Desulfococcus multivorans]AQV01776.1 CoA-binding protein [Desulfococcus multivorans]EPR41201.1 CoA-binding domain protein [Desulfococcus multivorans DSM 2059]MDX9817787.1 acetate--CoA ligase family protein [Desulfococcus multivorans]SKA25378.1 acetyltransferase [Desulfococcus multivorans DSM 2059]